MYLVERYLPGFTEEELRAACLRVREAAMAATGRGVPVAHVSSAFLPLEESVFCLFEGGSADDVRSVTEAAAFPFERITEVLLLTPGDLPEPLASASPSDQATADRRRSAEEA
jgi:hypothetical protein